VDAHDFPVSRSLRRAPDPQPCRAEPARHGGGGSGPEIHQAGLGKVKETQRDKAWREVRLSLLLTRIAEREAIGATRDEVDKEVERLARQQREPVAALQMNSKKDGTMGRIASHIQTEKTLNFLFEHARKTA